MPPGTDSTVDGVLLREAGHTPGLSGFGFTNSQKAAHQQVTGSALICDGAIRDGFSEPDCDLYPMDLMALHGLREPLIPEGAADKPFLAIFEWRQFDMLVITI